MRTLSVFRRTEGTTHAGVAQMLESRVVPRIGEQYRDNLDSKRMLERLKQGRVYTFAFFND